MNEVFETYDCTGKDAVPLELLEVLNGDLLEKMDVPGARSQDGDRPVTVRYLQPGEPPPPYDPTHPERLFCRYADDILALVYSSSVPKSSVRLTYNPRTGSFVSLNTPRPWEPQVHDTHTRAKVWDTEEDLLPCLGCQYQAAGLHASPSVRITTTPDHSAIQINNEIYHENDAILFSKQDSVARGAPSLQIGQIKSWHWNGRNSKVEITLFKCWDEFFSVNISAPAQEVPLSPPVPREFASDPVRNWLFLIILCQVLIPDKRHLYLSIQKATIHPSDIVLHAIIHDVFDFNATQGHPEPPSLNIVRPGEFYVTHRATSSKPRYPDNFRALSEPLPHCTVCKEMVRQWHEYSNTAKTHFKEEPLKVMDVGCGAGGFSAGLGSTGSFKPMWGIDIDAEAAGAYEQNFPEATVFVKHVEVYARTVIENLDKLNGRIEHKPVFIETQSGEKQVPAVGEVECMLISTPW
jgi:hypothetical protein